ncbi:hypothetical protein EV2_002945 [Malus domestica]
MEEMCSGARDCYLRSRSHSSHSTHARKTLAESMLKSLLLGTDGQKGRAAKMVMKSPARDYRNCCDDGCRSWLSWSCRQRRGGEENSYETFEAMVVDGSCRSSKDVCSAIETQRRFHQNAAAPGAEDWSW